MYRDSRIVVIWILIVLLLGLAACGQQTANPSSTEYLLAATPANPINAVCDACDQATLASALTQEKNNADNQAAATALALA